MENHHSNHIEAAQRQLISDSQLTSAATSTEVSRISSASHSRNSSAGIPSDPAHLTAAVSILKDGSNQQDPSIMNTFLSKTVPVIRNTSTLANPMSDAFSTQALLNPETNLPNS